MIVQRQHFKVRIFVEGDHMLQYKICGRDGPTSTNEDRYPCPCCSETAPNVLSYDRPVSQLAKSPNSLLPSVPVEQNPPDCAHGVVNVLYTVGMPLVENFLINECGMSRKTWTHMFSSYGPDAQPAAASDADDPTQPDYLQRSITNAVEFFMQAKYLDIVDVLRVREQGQTRNFNGVPVATHKLLSAMFEHAATMLKVAYNPKPSATDIVYVSQAASNLRKILHALQAKGTVWGHVWTCHVSQFLTRWGTLYPFLCHGLEGRWRSLKAEIKLSTHGQWKGAKVGFAQVLVYSVVAWALVRLGIKLVGRTTSVTKTKTALFDDFCNRMQDVREGKCTHPIVL